MEKINNEEFFKAYNCIYLKNELSSAEQKVLILLIGFDKNKKGNITVPNSTFVSYGINVRTLNRIKKRLKELRLIDIVYSKTYNGENYLNVYIINKERINEYFNCKIYDIKKQYIKRDPVKSESVLAFEAFLKSQENNK